MDTANNIFLISSLSVIILVCYSVMLFVYKYIDKMNEEASDHYNSVISSLKLNNTNKDKQ